MSDTIFALASAAGRAAVSVIRVSGELSSSVVLRLMGRVPPPRMATLAKLHDASGSELDQALVIWFPAPHSFTGEDCLELQLHGSRAVISAVLAALGAMNGLRLAEPGEFSRRAFINGKMDLAQAEGLADLIDSETEGQRRQALRQLDGELGRKVTDWQQQILNMQVLIEANLDFSDEGDVEILTHVKLIESAANLISDIDESLQGFQRARYVQTGFHIAILGRPNVGKSSLLNFLARREAVIVSDEAGTTRDLVQATVFMNEIEVTFTDTAGLRETDQAVEKQGIERAKRAADHADLVLLLTDSLEDFPQTEFSAPCFRVQTKSDLGLLPLETVDFLVSTKSGAGMESLYQSLTQYLSGLPQGSGLVTRERHALALQACRSALVRVHDSQTDTPLELLAEDLRSAAFELGRVAGHYGVEDILGALFSTFCIGK